MRLLCALVFRPTKEQNIHFIDWVKCGNIWNNKCSANVGCYCFCYYCYWFSVCQEVPVRGSGGEVSNKPAHRAWACALCVSSVMFSPCGETGDISFGWAWTVSSRECYWFHWGSTGTSVQQRKCNKQPLNEGCYKETEGEDAKETQTSFVFYFSALFPFLSLLPDNASESIIHFKSQSQALGCMI